MLLTEVLKLFVCLLALALRRGRGGSVTARSALASCAASTPLALPALLFTAQSQLNLFAATHLDAVAFQVTNQLKLLPTAFFSALYLGRRLSGPQWAALPALALGVGVVNSGAGAAGSDTHGGARFGPDWWAGLFAALAAAVLSGYAGVYCERLLKVPGTALQAQLHAAQARSPARPRLLAAGSPGSSGGGPGLGAGLAGRAPWAFDSPARGAPGSPRAQPLGSPCAQCCESGDAGCFCAQAGGNGAGGGGGGALPPGVGAGVFAGVGGGAGPAAAAPPSRAVPLLTLNVALSAWGALFAGAQVALGVARSSAPCPNPLAHFTPYAWAVVLLQAGGGIIVSFVILHTDNLVRERRGGVGRLVHRGLAAARARLSSHSAPHRPPFCVAQVKGFAMGVSILLSYAVSIPLFGLQMSASFVAGLVLVVGAVVVFSAAGSHGPALGAPPPPRLRDVSRSPARSRAAAPDEGEAFRWALAAGVALGLTLGLLWHSTALGGAGWTSALLSLN